LIFCKELKVHYLNENIIKQLLKCATSVGANYQETNGCESKKDFKNKINICKKEFKETMYRLRLLAKLFPERKEKIKSLWKEAHQLVLIFAAINKKT
jgi:four helix bundle protein